MTTEGAASEFVPAASAEVNPWLIAVVVSLAAFMEVLDTSIANGLAGQRANSGPKAGRDARRSRPF